MLRAGRDALARHALLERVGVVAGLDDRSADPQHLAARPVRAALVANQDDARLPVVAPGVELGAVAPVGDVPRGINKGIERRRRDD